MNRQDEDESSIPGLIFLAVLAIAVLSLMLLGCAGYPVALEIRGETSSIRISESELTILFEK